MGLDMTSFDAALKDYYTDNAVEDMTYKDRPFYALVPKMTEFYGRRMPIPLIYGNPQGRSATFARAQARGATSTTAVEDFLLTRVKNYAVATIDNETLEASQNDKGAFLDAATIEFDGAINNVTNDIALDMYLDGWGDRGVIGSISTTTITLATIADAVNFEVGMELDLSASQAANTLRAYGSSGNGLIITAINRDTGVLTFGANVTDATDGIPTAAANDYIFVRGDRQNSATPTRLKIAGLESWNPYTAPTSTLFFGVNRAIDTIRLGGLRYDGSAVPIEEALIEAASRVGRHGGTIDHFFMPFEKWSDLEKSLGSKVQYVDLMANANIGFRSIRINGPKGEIKCVPDKNCPANRIRGVRLGAFKLCSLGKAVRVIDTDGLKMLRQATADGVESRWGGYLNLACNSPRDAIAINV